MAPDDRQGPGRASVNTAGGDSSSHPQRLRTLAPRAEVANEPEALPSVLAGTNYLSRPLIKRESHVPAACEACRHLKRKCNGARPVCQGCMSQQRECIYTTQPSETRAAAVKRKAVELTSQLEELQDAHDELLQLLLTIRDSTEADAAIIFGRIRRGDDMLTVVRDI